MTLFLRDFYNVYSQALEIMKERADNGYANNEGVLFNYKIVEMSLKSEEERNNNYFVRI